MKAVERMPVDEKSITMIGAGAAGFSAAILFQRAGWRVELLEQRRNIRSCRDPLAVSYNVTLNPAGRI